MLACSRRCLLAAVDMPGCIAPQCSSFHSKSGCEDLSWHTFPNEPVKLKQWLAAIRRENFTVTSTTRICYLHFKDSDYEAGPMVLCDWTDRKRKRRRVLQLSAVPSVFPFPHNRPVCPQFVRGKNGNSDLTVPMQADSSVYHKSCQR